MKSRKQTKRDAKQLFRLCLVNGLLDENRTRGVAQYVAAAGYRNCPAILAHFLRLVRLDRTQHSATIESASPLPADVQADIQASLASRYRGGLNTVFTSRPSLLGGVRIQVGSDVYDGSVRAGLEALEKSF